MAKYDGTNPVDIQKAKKRVESLIKNRKFFEIREITDKSLSQNNYFHLIVSYFAALCGYSMYHAKQVIVKEQICPDIFMQERFSETTGEAYSHKRSFADLTKEEASTCIETFISYVWEHMDVHLPRPEDLIYLREAQKEVDRCKTFLV